MNLNELTDLIKVREYVVSATGNGAIDRKTVNYLNGLLIMVDRKILALLECEAFKQYVDYKDIKQAIADVAQHNNIKSGLQRNPHTGHLEKISK